MDLSSNHRVHEIVLVYILTIAIILLLLSWFSELCSWIYNSLYIRMQHQQWQQGINNEIADDPEVGSVDNIHELFMRVWEDLGLSFQLQTLRHQRDKAIEKFPPPEIYDVENTKMSPTSTTVCVICLEEFVSGALFRVLPLCKHIYHSECINRWLSFHEQRCPICRSSI